MTQPPPAWMETLVDVVAECLDAHSPMGPLGFRYLEEDAHGELVIYPTPVELVGGADDSTVVVPGFALDLHALLAAFERVTALQWCAHGCGRDMATIWRKMGRILRRTYFYYVKSSGFVVCSLSTDSMITPLSH